MNFRGFRFEFNSCLKIVCNNIRIDVIFPLVSLKFVLSIPFVTIRFVSTRETRIEILSSRKRGYKRDVSSFFILIVSRNRCTNGSYVYIYIYPWSGDECLKVTG